MKTNKIKDERIMLINQKIQSDACLIMMVFLAISIITQAFIFKAPFIQFSAEIICLLLGGVYILIMGIVKGSDYVENTSSRKKILLINVLVPSIAVTAINGFSNYINYGHFYNGIFDIHFIAILLITFVSMAIPFYIVFSLLDTISRRAQQKLESKINDDDK